MTEEQQSNVLAAAFPNPPPFYQNFTPQNLERIAALRAEQGITAQETLKDSQTGLSGASQVKQHPRLLDLPPELRFLQPPEPPITGIYRSFGDVYNLNEILPSLADQGIEQLYTPPGTPSSSLLQGTSNESSHNDRALILKRLAKSLLLNFLELMGIMSTNPSQYAEKIQDLRTLFINFHHLLNEYRPHQARESLILMMEDQLSRAKAETEGMQRMKINVEDILTGLGQAKLATDIGRDEKTAEDFGSAGKKDDEERVVWKALVKEFG